MGFARIAAVRQRDPVNPIVILLELKQLAFSATSAYNRIIDLKKLWTSGGTHLRQRDNVALALLTVAS
jgi:hypothetical protein